MTKIESGRSMVEMLGVLAIIGVLSIGGIAGYTMAMNRHRANTAIDYATKLAIAAQTQGENGMQGGPVDGSTLGITAPTGYAAQVTQNAQGNTYDVTFTSGVTQGDSVANAINAITGGKTSGTATIKFGEAGIVS